MKIINVSQAHETEAWLDERVGRITGTKSGGLALEHYAQTDVEKLKESRDKALEQAKKAKTPIARTPGSRKNPKTPAAKTPAHRVHHLPQQATPEKKLPLVITYIVFIILLYMLNIYKHIGF